MNKFFLNASLLASIPILMVIYKFLDIKDTIVSKLKLLQK